jgi:hypothetical protein
MLEHRLGCPLAPREPGAKSRVERNTARQRQPIVSARPLPSRDGCSGYLKGYTSKWHTYPTPIDWALRGAISMPNPCSDRITREEVAQIDLLRLNLVTRLYDKEMARKDMLEKSAYFLIAALGIIVSAGLLESKNISSVITTFKTRMSYPLLILLVGIPCLLCIVSLLFKIYQATKMRQWHSGMPPDLTKVLYDQELITNPDRMVETIVSYMIAGHNVAYANNNSKAFWIQAGSLSLIAIIFIVGTTTLSILVF